jgi:hypothetical protein
MIKGGTMRMEGEYCYHDKRRVANHANVGEYGYHDNGGV